MAVFAQNVDCHAKIHEIKDFTHRKERRRKKKDNEEEENTDETDIKKSLFLSLTRILQ